MSKCITFSDNMDNFLLMIVVGLPSIFMGYDCIHNCVYSSNVLLFNSACHLGMENPLLFVNVVFFFGVCMLFWLISLVQDSTWLIDPYWTIIPPFIGLFYHYHPLAHGDPKRSIIALALTIVWSVRLTHSYFRRENYCFGKREDWRFTDMKVADPKNWWWKSLFAAFVSQQPMLIGITLPLWAINLYPIHGMNSVSIPFGIIDKIATIGCVSGILIAYIADTQLQQFMTMNENRLKKGQLKVLIFRSGLWKYSRHPNYFGEQLWWWSLAIFSISVGQSWTFIGTAFNTAIMMQVTILTENRMLADKNRYQQFKEYQDTTSVWIPWFRIKPKKLI